MKNLSDTAETARAAAANSNSPVLVVTGVNKSYGSTPVLRDVSFELAAGERVALVGPSGSGKTTLLNCLGGVDRSDSGSIVLHGETIEKLSSDRLARLRRESIGTVFQFFHLLPTLTAFENVELPLQLLGYPPDERKQRSRKVLERINMMHRADGFPGQLSGGEMQRIAIARALVHKPALILADEPTGNLDSVNGENILNLLEELSNETRTALLLVTHSIEATRICHRTIQMRDGMIVGEIRR